MPKSIPQRQCVGCRVKKPKPELIRVVRAPDGAISLDARGKAAGRGAYLCPSPACLKKAQKNRALERAFDVPIPAELYEQLAAELEAGRIALGEHDAGAAARAGRACLLLLAQDASDNARKRAEGFAHAAQAPLLRLPYTKQALSDRLGKTGCAIAAVTDPGLAKAFVSALAQANPEQYSNTAAELAAQTRTDTGTAQTSGGRNGKRRKRV